MRKSTKDKLSSRVPVKRSSVYRDFPLSAKNGNNSGINTRHKRTDEQREADLALIARLLVRENLTQAEITKKLVAERGYTIGLQQVNHDVQELFKRWRDAYLNDIDILKGRELRRVDELESAYWASYERSLRGRNEYTEDITEYSGQEQDHLGYADGEVVEDSASEKKRTKRYLSRKFQDERDGEVRFLNGIQWCIDKRCEILGLNAPVRAEMTFDWRSEAQKQGHDPSVLFNELVKKFVDGNTVDGEVVEARQLMEGK